jgi:hypothetical protein
MAPHLGKRKRITREELEEASRSPTPETGSGSSGSEEEEGGADIHDIFRRAFEAKFKPLEVEKKKLELEKEDEVLEDEEEESDWSGISDEDEEAHKIEVVDVSQSHNKNERMSKAEMRAFMVSRNHRTQAITPKMLTHIRHSRRNRPPVCPPQPSHSPQKRPLRMAATPSNPPT